MSDERDTSSRLKTYASRLVGCVILLLLAWALVSGLWHREETPQESGPASTGTANDSQGAAPRGQPQAGDGQAPRELPTETGQGAGPDGPWSAEILDDSSVRVLLRQAPVVKAEYRFWDANWQWANPELSVARNVDGLIAVEGTVRDLGLEIAGAIANDPRNVLEYTYVVTANEDLSGITGGGLEFQLDLGSPAFDGAASEPVLFENQSGWQWNVGKDQAIRVKFTKPLAELYFERGNKGIIRTLFIGSELEQGTHTYTMRLTLPEGASIVPSAAERYGYADTADWHPNALLWNKSPVDLRFLNHRPAGSRGFVRAEGDALVFEDGGEARFWGTNLAAGALFVSDSEIEEQSRRIAQLGYNLVRFHHHDSMRWVDPTVIDKSRSDSQHLNAEALARLDYWITCLRDEGVYVWLDLHVGRQFKEGDIESAFGRILGYEEIARAGGEVKGFCYYDKTVAKLMMDFNEKYLDHVNPHTGLAYKEDPAVMGLLITNENDITHHFGNLMLPDKNNPVHNAIFEQSVDAFCSRTGLPRSETWRTWLPGPSKIYLNHHEHLFNAELLGHLAVLGVRVPVATTNTWGAMSLFSLPALADGGILDVHSYGEAEALSKNPRYVPNYVSWMAAGQVHGKPMSVTEWSVPYDTIDRFTAPLYVASVACLQGWDAMMIYNYSQQGTFSEPATPYVWSTFADPALTAVMPAAALAYRRGDVSAATTTYCLEPDGRRMFFEDISPRTSAALRTLAERSRVTIGLPQTPGLPWLRGTDAPDATLVSDPGQDFIPAGREFVESDTGELRRDWVRGIHTIDTPSTQAASGWIGGEPITLQDVTFEIDTRKAVIAVTSHDEVPIRESGHILVTTVARVVPSGDRMPYLSEPVVGTIGIRARSGLRLHPLEPDGARGPGIEPAREDGRYSITLDGSGASHWFVLE